MSLILEKTQTFSAEDQDPGAEIWPEKSACEARNQGISESFFSMWLNMIPVQHKEFSLRFSVREQGYEK